MIKKIEFIKLYIRNSKKKYIFHMGEILTLGLLFHIVFYNFYEINQVKKILEDSKAGEIYQAEYKIGKTTNSLHAKLIELQRSLPQGIKIIGPSKTYAFTNQLSGNKQVTASFLSLNEIMQFKYPVSMGEYFNEDWKRKDVYPAIINKELNRKYSIGKEYEIIIKKNLMPLRSIKIKIMGVRKNNYILDLSYETGNVFKRDANILIYDQRGELSSHFYTQNNGLLPIILKSANQSEQSLASKLEGSGLINIRNLEKSVMDLTGLKFKDLNLYITLISVIIPLIIISISSFFYLEFQSKKREVFIFLSNGLSHGFFFYSISIVNFIVFVMPVFIQEMIWYFICLLMKFEFLWLQSILIIFIYFFVAIIMTVLNTYYVSRIKFNGKMLDYEVTSD